jgi:hypothetical protein
MYMAEAMSFGIRLKSSFMLKIYIFMYFTSWRMARGNWCLSRAPYDVCVVVHCCWGSITGQCDRL